MTAKPVRAPPSACSDAQQKSLDCIMEHYDDGQKATACRPFFLAYRECKEKAYDEARAARIRARDGN
jgi:hypothetical protein